MPGSRTLLRPVQTAVAGKRLLSLTRERKSLLTYLALSAAYSVGKLFSRCRGVPELRRTPPGRAPRAFTPQLPQPEAGTGSERGGD
jgi:hypothetical protein